MSDPQITEEMRAAAIAAATADPQIAAMAGRGAGVFHALPSIVDVALRAALAGRTVIDLPEPDEAPRMIPPGLAEWDGVWGPTWISEQRPSLVASWHLGDDMTPADAEALGLALVAAAREARRLAAVSSKGGEPRG